MVQLRVLEEAVSRIRTVDRRHRRTYPDALLRALRDDRGALPRQAGDEDADYAVVVESDPDGVVRSIEDLQQADVWINGGFYVFRRDVLDEINPGEELVIEPFRRLIEREELIAYRYEGFWEPMDTIKDKQRLDALVEGGNAPWRNTPSAGSRST